MGAAIQSMYMIEYVSVADSIHQYADEIGGSSREISDQFVIDCFDP